MTCTDAIRQSASSTAGIDTDQGRALVAERDRAFAVAFVPRLPDGALNEAAVITRPELWPDIESAVEIAKSEYGASDDGWSAMEQLPRETWARDGIRVEGHHVGPKQR